MWCGIGRVMWGVWNRGCLGLVGLGWFGKVRIGVGRMCWVCSGVEWL